MSLINDLVKYSNLVYQKGFVSATDGNLSVRIDESRIAITRSGICKGEVQENDIVIVDNFGNFISGNGRASTELKIHLLAYNKRKEVNAVIHCHPIYTTALASANQSLEDPIFPEFILTFGKVPLCKYGTPSTDELPDSMKPFIDKAWAMLLQNHGAVTFGKNLHDAYFKMEKLEHTAKILNKAQAFGGAKLLPNQKVCKLKEIAQSVYGIEINKEISELNNSSANFLEIINQRIRDKAGNKPLK